MTLHPTFFPSAVRFYAAHCKTNGPSVPAPPCFVPGCFPQTAAANAQLACRLFLSGHRQEWNTPPDILSHPFPSSLLKPSFSSLLSQSLCSALPHTDPPPHLHPPACLGDTWSGLSLIPGQLFSLPRRGSPDNTAQADTDIIKNEKQLVRDSASVDMK